jgi:hypothetical protein
MQGVLGAFALLGNMGPRHARGAGCLRQFLLWGFMGLGAWKDAVVFAGAQDAWHSRGKHCACMRGAKGVRGLRMTC